MTTITIELPWPDSRLWPNRHSGEDWRFRQKPKQVAKELAYWEAKALGVTLAEVRMPIRYTFHASTNRRYDLEGAHSACKAYVDGIAKALGIDDFFFEPASCHRGEPVKPGKVVIEIG